MGEAARDRGEPSASTGGPLAWKGGCRCRRWDRMEELGRKEGQGMAQQVREEPQRAGCLLEAERPRPRWGVAGAGGVGALP